MTMSRQHFQMIADVMKQGKPEKRDAKLFQFWESGVHAFAYELARTNPRFNRTRFLKACGIEQPEVR